MSMEEGRLCTEIYYQASLEIAIHMILIIRARAIATDYDKVD